MQKWILCLTLSVASVTAQAQLAGVWIDQAYWQTLQRSYSPRAAIAASQIPLLTVSAEADRMALSLNMHEMPEYAITRYDRDSGNIQLATEADFVRSLIFDGNHLSLHYTLDDTPATAHFTRIAKAGQDPEISLAHQVAEQILAGNYHNRNNRPYHFSSTTANWEGEQFNYRIILDYVMFSPMDLLCRTNAQGGCETLYGFAANGNIVQIYAYDGDTFQLGQLLLELTKIEE